MNPDNSNPGNGMYNQGNPDLHNANAYDHQDGTSEHSGSNDANYKSRRRSKKDNEGRNFK